MDAFACLEAPLMARPARGGVGNRFQMHFNPRFVYVKQCHVLPLAQVKISAQQVVDVELDVYIESCGYVGCVAVGGF